MKRTVFIKNLISVALCAPMLLGFGTAVSAESEPVADAVLVEEAIPEESAPEIDATPETGEVPETGEAPETGEVPEIDNPFEDIFEAASEFSAEIASALAFIGSVLVAFAYKRGLLPSVKSGIVAIGGAVGQLKDSTESTSRHQEQMLEEFTERLSRAEDVLERFGKAIDEIAEKTEDGKSAAADRADMKALMSAQIDMLYDIFMTSSLPQYQKDAVNQRVREMREVTGLGKDAD